MGSEGKQLWWKGLSLPPGHPSSLSYWPPFLPWGHLGSGSCVSCPTRGGPPRPSSSVAGQALPFPVLGPCCPAMRSAKSPWQCGPGEKPCAPQAEAQPLPVVWPWKATQAL